jgi:hypothetical protein
MFRWNFALGDPDDESEKERNAAAAMPASPPRWPGASFDVGQKTAVFFVCRYLGTKFVPVRVPPMALVGDIVLQALEVLRLRSAADTMDLSTSEDGPPLDMTLPFESEGLRVLQKLYLRPAIRPDHRVTSTSASSSSRERFLHLPYAVCRIDYGHRGGQCCGHGLRQRARV